jgi:toxin ParE1/3/4
VQVQLRAAAKRDVDDAVDYYRDEAGSEIALGFIDSLETAITHLCQHPLSGSLRFAFELEIPDLRSCSVPRVPYLLFYLPDEDRIDIWRVCTPDETSRRPASRPARLGPDDGRPTPDASAPPWGSSAPGCP